MESTLSTQTISCSYTANLAKWKSQLMNDSKASLLFLCKFRRLQWKNKEEGQKIYKMFFENNKIQRETLQFIFAKDDKKKIAKICELAQRVLVIESEICAVNTQENTEFLTETRDKIAQTKQIVQEIQQVYLEVHVKGSPIRMSSKKTVASEGTRQPRREINKSLGTIVEIFRSRKSEGKRKASRSRRNASHALSLSA